HTMQYRSQAKDSNKESGKKLLQETETQELQKTNQPKKTPEQISNHRTQKAKTKQKHKTQAQKSSFPTAEVQ
ncbi:hypothetical protein, partial [Klebsiella pneumoniae]|uniref:hypothetical protein n=1 Tax=Klebsiella pneumoniae TaxID=573 RepID=UPI003A8C30EA